MTGEITLRGKVLPIGGLKEKMLAAHRFGLNTLVIPRDNEKDLADIPAEVRDELTINIVDDIDEVLHHALETQDSAVAADLPQIWAPDQTVGDISSAVVE